MWGAGGGTDPECMSEREGGQTIGKILENIFDSETQIKNNQKEEMGINWKLNNCIIVFIVPSKNGIDAGNVKYLYNDAEK